jgi:hypothetical protein
LRAKLEKVRRESQGRVVPPQLVNEKQPNPEDEIMFDMLFEMYTPESNFYVVLKSYCEMWDLELDGEEISLLHMMWKEVDAYSRRKQKEKMDNAKKSSGSGSTPKGRPHRPSRGRRR